MSDYDELDLDARRASRATRRREAGRKPLVLTFGGSSYPLPPELPVHVFAPLRDVSADLGLLLRAAADAAGPDGRADAASTLLSVFAANENLAPALLAALERCARNLAGDEAYDALMAWGPSAEDLAEIGRGVLTRYGVSLGESSPSSPSSTSEETSSSATSQPTTPDSTPAGPGPATETPASSAPAA